MRGRRAPCVLVALCAASCGATATTTDFTDPRGADDRPAGTVTVVVGNETPVPITGVQVTVDGETLDVTSAERPVAVTIGPGEHDLVLDLLLSRDGPAVFRSLRAYETRVRGETRIAVEPGCRLVLRATAFAPAQLLECPEIRFHHLMECAPPGALGPEV